MNRLRALLGRPHVRRLLIGAGLAALALGVVAFGSVVRYSRASDGACLRCHESRSVVGWGPAADPAHSDVSCVECHGQLDEALPGTGHLARADHVEQHCRRCHPEAARWDDLSQVQENPFGVRFSHRRHLERPEGQAHVGCVGCHQEMFHRLEPRAHDRPSKATCLRGCHQDAADADACQSCHEQRVVQPPAEPDESFASCTGCHWTLATSVQLVGGRQLRHSLHEAGGVGCARCHLTAGEHGATVGPDQCSTCHHETLRKVVECESCHRPERNWRNASVLGGVQLEPALVAEEDGMVGLADCGDCHPDVAGGSTTSERPAIVAGCLECHAEDEPPRDVEALVGGWRDAHQEALALLSRINDDGLRPNGTERATLEELLRRDASAGAHNPGLTRVLLERVRRLRRAMGLEPMAVEPGGLGVDVEQEAAVSTDQESRR